MKGYKAFEKGLICRGKQYAENTVFEEDTAVICQSGMHFCKNPLDTLDYYPLIDDNGNMTEFAEVEALDEALTDDNKKYCTKKMKVGAKLSLAEFVKLSFSVTKEQIMSDVKDKTGKDETKKIGGNDANLVGGNYAKLVGGYGAKLVGGYGANLVGGDDAKLVGGDDANLVGGNYANLVGGDDAKLVGGDDAKLVGGNDANLVGGNDAKLVGGNYANLVGGKHSILVGENESIGKGKKGTLLVLVERERVNGEYVIKSFKADLIDGEKIKEDTFYKLVKGEFVEV